jgi:hypothetical protein
MGGTENGGDPLAIRKAGGGDTAQALESIMDFVVQPALGHLPVGENSKNSK